MELNFQDSAEKNRAEIEIRRFRVCGIVQGVGFRPFVHRLAKKHEAFGWVLNDSEGVLLELQASPDAIDNIIFNIKSNPPPLAKVINVYEVERNEVLTCYQSFDIRKSDSLMHMDTIIPPDTNVCIDCLEEMRDPCNRRYRYAFINCTNCGPRYSIIHGMPYDRAKSTMQKFALCSKCSSEYADIEDRRYHAQPNACPDCGPRLLLTDKDGNEIVTSDIINFSINHLKKGAIFAIKSLGGFHLVVDANNSDAIQNLRSRKKRDSKPFAVMVPSIECAKKIAFVNSDEEFLLESVERPIVLLKKKGDKVPDVIAPHNPSVGVMLPSTPLQYLLLEDSSLNMLVMTSGNSSGHPIVYKNNDALEQLSNIADYFILNDREIVIRIDDSVVRVISRESWDMLDERKNMTTFIRRSRGYAPYPIHLPYSVGSIAAFGAELKTTVSLGKGKQVFMSQHIGDLKNDITFKSHYACAKHIQNLLDIPVDTIACDMHPAYRSTNFALQQSNLNIIQVQHHHAHMASCMAENGLTGPTLGVIFDGTGYGIDGTIWGGEFLFGDYAHFIRAAHMQHLFLPGGDSAVKEPARIAISLLVETFGQEASKIDVPVNHYMSIQELNVFNTMASRKINSPMTSSIGRLFDGISSLLGICHKVEYEAQAAIELEALLGRDLRMGEPYSFHIDDSDECWIIDYRPMIKEIVDDLQNEIITVNDISRRFHSSVVYIIARVCKLLATKFNTTQVVLSGGVFCNEFLLSNSMSHLEALGLRVHCHQLVPSNDGGISLGQLVIATEKSKLKLKDRTNERG